MNRIELRCKLTALLDSLQRDIAFGSVILMATLLASWTIDGTALHHRIDIIRQFNTIFMLKHWLDCNPSAARLTRLMKLGSSEFSDSFLATISTLLASRAILDVLSTILCGCRLTIAFSQRAVYFNMESSAIQSFQVIVKGWIRSYQKL